MKVLIIPNGEIKNYELYKDFVRDYDIIIFADGGANHAYNMGLKPAIVIGNWIQLKKILDFYEKGRL